MIWVNLEIGAILGEVKELSSIDQLKLDGNRAANGKVEEVVVRKVENVAVGKVEDPAAVKAVTKGAKTKKPWCRLISEFPQGPIWGKAHQGFIFQARTRDLWLKENNSIYCTLQLSPIRSPKVGYRGKVLLTFDDNLSAKVGVRCDKPFPYGIDLGGLCDDSHGYFCQVSELFLEVTGVDDLDKLLTKTLFQVVFNESRNSPFILFMKDAEKLMAGNSDSYSTFKCLLEKLPDNVVIIGSHAHTDNHKDKAVFNESRNSPFNLFMNDAEKLMGPEIQNHIEHLKVSLRSFLMMLATIGSHAHTYNHKEKDVFSENQNSPFILFTKDAVELMARNSESYSTFKSQLEKLSDNVVIIGSHAHTDNHEEKIDGQFTRCSKQSKKSNVILTSRLSSGC